MLDFATQFNQRRYLAMDEEIKGLGDYLVIIKRRNKEFVVPAILILIVCVSLVLILPSIYRSEATILIEQQEVPTDLVRSTVTSFAGERIQIISQRVMTSENLGKIIKEYNIYPDAHSSTSRTELVERLREEIGLEMISADVVDPRSGRPTTATIAFKLSFSSKSPQLAQKVTNELVSLYLNENLKRRTQSALETSGFLSTEADKLNDRVAELEKQLASFKERNLNNLPEHQQLNLQLMERNDRELSEIKQQIRTLEERKIYLRSELSQMNPTSDLYTSSGNRIMGAEDRLMALQTEYAGLSATYTESHPRLMKMRSEIDALKKEVGIDIGDVDKYRQLLRQQREKLTQLRNQYVGEHPKVVKQDEIVKATQAALEKALQSSIFARTSIKVKADNPAYIQLLTQLNAAEGDLASLQRTREEIKAKIKGFEERLMRTPQVEREYRNLTRNYENALAKFQEVKAKQLEAELSESLERERKGERFSLIEPPQLPEKPAKPNRMAILFLGFIFSFVGGIGNVAIRESLDKSIHGTKDLIAITGAPPLAVIPYIKNDRDRRQKHSWRRQWVIGVVISALVGITAIHFFLKPLDVLWYVVLRKLGIETGI